MIRRLVQQIFPPPRQSLTLWSALPLILFIALFLLTWLSFEWAAFITFSRPTMFWLIVLAPWVWWMWMGSGSGLVGVRAHLALWVRLVLLGLFIMLLAQPRSVREHERLAVVFAVDLSASIGAKASDASLSYVMRAATEKPLQDEVGLVVFGDDASVELPPQMAFPFEALTLQVGRDGTNIERGLALAGAVIPEESQGRIVLISDGVQTDGNFAAVLDDLKSRNISVDVLPVQYEYEHEVWIERLELPRHVKAGETYEAAAIISSQAAGEGELVLEENGRVIQRIPVQFQAGKNRVRVPIYLRDAGYYEYTATLNVPQGQDGWTRNNKAIGSIYLQGRGKVMLVVDPAGDERDWTPLQRALIESQREVVVRSPYDVPSDALSLLPYDCIIFVNVAADHFSLPQMTAVKDAVYNQGSGFIMVGGANSFGPGGYHRTVIEDTLPVTMDVSQKKVLPKGGLVIVLHTCEFADGNTWGKEITKAAIRAMGRQDEVGVLAYDWMGGRAGDSWIFPMTPAGQYEQLVPLINAAQIGDMPSFAGTMRMGLAALNASDAAMKHMIIISDGDPSPPPDELLASFRINKVSVSTVAVFPHGNDVTLMQKIAAATGGRFYFPNDPNVLPQIFVKEARTLKRSMIQNKRFVPSVEFPSPILKGLPELSSLNGYVLTTPKDRSITILKGPEREQVDPILSTWNFGVGKAAAFTSDLSSKWAGNWMLDDTYDVFVQQMVTEISRVNEQSQLRMQSYAAGNTGVVTVEDYAPDGSFLDLEATVTGPSRQAMTLPLKQVAVNRYEATFPLWGEGRYQVTADGAGAGRKERTHSGFAVPYSQEYLRFRSDPIALNEIAQRTGGRILAGRETGKELFDLAREKRRSSRPIADWFLMLLAILVPLDVGLRRVHLDWAVIRRAMGLQPRHAPAAETFDALRQRKASVSSSLEKPRLVEVQAKPLDPALQARVEPAVQPKPEDSSSTKPQAVPPPDESAQTTSRLLALKKRRQDGGPPPGDHGSQT